MDRKQAVVVIHGMGEQMPMQTLNDLVNAVWTTDATLTDPEAPDPETGGPRIENVSWTKPDDRNFTTEVRRITTEPDIEGDRTDFYEFYWAHLMHGTTLEHVKAWLVGLLWRNPFKRVPRNVLTIWVLLWVFVIVGGAGLIYSWWPKEDPSPVSPFIAVGSGLAGLIAAGFVSNVMLKRFGDVARYVRAAPPNVARRMEIRKEGVALLHRLTESGDYDRIVVVAHSLGTIVAYDVLNMLFDDYNKDLKGGRASALKQPERVKLEDMIRAAAGLPVSSGDYMEGGELDLDAYQAQQARALAELQGQGFKWLVTDFVTLGAPLTHAEFLLAEDRAGLRRRQLHRELPTCPPALMYDLVTQMWHIGYDPEETKGRKHDWRRVPHHAAVFGYTRWTNLYSEAKAIVLGDVISGPVGEVFGHELGEKAMVGIRDVAVMPKLTPFGRVDEGHVRRLITHNNYWLVGKGTDKSSDKGEHHIDALRKAVGLRRKM
ncbi:hypothetical protein ACRARG_05365 [Pseudooceanicola sp. C21-150M6]|uniref:hypothetical protein n=1 Tax=Pseudooceanicola sp. C21-150M6 TaxID=3434355 RepID=UPI003D7FFC17